MTLLQTPIGKLVGLWIKTRGESHQIPFACVLWCSFSTTLAPTACQNLHNCPGVYVNGNCAHVFDELVEFASVTLFKQYRDSSQSLRDPSNFTLKAAHLCRV